MTFLTRPRAAAVITGAVAAPLAIAALAFADTAPQTLPFGQDWSNTGLITTDDNWSAVPGITGFRGDNLTAATGADPQTIVADGSATPVDVNANRSDPNTFITGGVTEFELTNPSVALSGSGTADAPHLVVFLNTAGQTDVNVAYNLRDLDGSADNAQQQVALQYRVGNSGSFTNVPAGYVADATSGPSLATQVTPVSATLPDAADDQAQVQVRVITSNAVGNDEWVGVDDINITGTPVSTAPDSCDDPGVITGSGVITGTPGDDFICGSAGADQIDALGGDDTILAGDGNDTVLDGDGNDRSVGEGGNDILGAGTGDDEFVGGDGRDRVSYATRTGAVEAEIGVDGNGEGTESDSIDFDVEELNGGSGNDTLTGDEDGNTLRGNPGDDSVSGGGGADLVRGLDGTDTVSGGAGDDTVEGNNGNDTLTDGSGADLVLGGDGDDGNTLSADGSRDFANCGNGTDTFTISEGLDGASRNCETRLQ